MTRLRAQEFQPKLVTLCAASGVAVVFHPQLSKTYANGATKWLAPDRALLQLSIRGCYADRLWFSFFHEAAHLLIHGKSLSFIECEGNNDTYEAEADRFAAEWLIPERAYREFRDTGSFGVNEVCKFSERLRIHTGIVVGRLEHEGLIRYGSLNRLKTILTWANT
jgi:Zn-dependent peptidase ImmA (M78 family)